MDKKGRIHATPKSGSKSVKNYDPKNEGGFPKGGGTKASKMYSPPKEAKTKYRGV